MPQYGADAEGDIAQRLSYFYENARLTLEHVVDAADDDDYAATAAADDDDDNDPTRGVKIVVEHARHAMDVFPKIYISHILRGQNAQAVKNDLLDQDFRRLGYAYRELVLMSMNGIELEDNHQFMRTTRIMMRVRQYISFSVDHTESNATEDPAGAAAAELQQLQAQQDQA